VGPVLVFGHRNPDNDSICSAVAYAHLKNLTDPTSVYVPARLGHVPRETAWVFEHFGVALPEEIAHVRTRVRDVMTPEPATVSVRDTLLDAGNEMRARGIRGLPVVDESGRVVGLVSVRMLAERYLEELDIPGFREMPTTPEHLARVLDGTLRAGSADARVSGDVLIGAMEPSSLAGHIKPGDVLIVGDRVRTQPMAVEAGVAALIITGGVAPADGVIEAAERRGCAVITTAHDTFSSARLVSLAHAVGDVMDTDILLVAPEDLLSEAAEDLFASTHREAISVDANGRPDGMLTRTNVARGLRRRVILVDHNEAAQSAAGIEDASVIEIVDHHRVGDIQTSAPILFLNVPVGSTATIVAMRYETLGAAIPDAIAGILLSAILTDTVLLKSPTATAVDRVTVERLAAQLCVEWMDLGMEVFRAKEGSEPFDAASAVRADLKEYRMGDVTAAIGQIETVDLGTVMAHAEDLQRELEAYREAHGLDLAVLMVTDIVREGTQVLAAGKTRLVERGLDVSLDGGSAWMPGVLSRKKQIAARLVEAAGV